MRDQDIYMSSWMSSQELEWRFPGAGAGRLVELLFMKPGFWFSDKQGSGDGWWGWLHSSVVILHSAELGADNVIIQPTSCYVHVAIILKRPPEDSPKMERVRRRDPISAIW